MSMPVLGQSVIYREGDYELGLRLPKAASDMPDDIIARGRHHPGTNGTRLHAALITRVWSANVVDLVVFRDATPPGILRAVLRWEYLGDGVRNDASGWLWRPDPLLPAEVEEYNKMEFAWRAAQAA